MDIYNVIIKPLVTEKSTHQHATRNAYAFQVHADANKPTIKLAVEKLYNVKVLDVRTLNRKGKPRRTKAGYTQAAGYKRAVVTLDENSKIELF
jgi:large subunit ribosomal protein L23